jgi:hypothetical protein
MRMLQVGSHIDLMNREERIREMNFSIDDFAELSLKQFVDSLKSVFTHGVPLETEEGALKLLGNLFELVALNDVTDLIVVKITKANAAFEADFDFLDILLEPSEGADSAIVDWLATAQHSGTP